MTASVVSIHRAVSNGSLAEPLAEARVLADFGIEGDYRSRKGRGRQITLIEEEALGRVAKALRRESIPPGASRRQVVVRGIALNETVGKRLRLGAVLIEVHDLCDPCGNMEKTVGRGARTAMEGCGGICARVIEGGALRPGDPVTLLP